MTSSRARPLLRSIAANVRALRLTRGLTQEALADLAGLERSHLQTIERAGLNLSIETLATLAVGLGVDPRELLAPAEMVKRPVGRPRRPVDAEVNTRSSQAARGKHRSRR